MIVNFLNNKTGVTPDDFVKYFQNIAGEGCCEAIKRFLYKCKRANGDVRSLEKASNIFYKIIANTRYNLRYGFPRSNRSIGQFLDFTSPKLENGTIGDSPIEVRISIDDAKRVVALQKFCVPPQFCADPENRILSSSYERTQGSGIPIYIYEIKSIEPSKNEETFLVHAECVPRQHLI